MLNLKFWKKSTISNSRKISWIFICTLYWLNMSKYALDWETFCRVRETNTRGFWRVLGHYANHSVGYDDCSLTIFMEPYVLKCNKRFNFFWQHTAHIGNFSVLQSGLRNALTLFRNLWCWSLWLCKVFLIQADILA